MKPMRILLINGPSLNTLGRREPALSGADTLADIVGRVERRATELGASIVPFQSNHEGAIIDFIQEQADASDGIVINGGALTHYGLGLRDAIAGSGLPAIEVHISNIYAREEFRKQSVTAPVCRGVITGLGWRGYVYALDAIIASIQEGAES
jgi:3-dehydroquinate dehydratase-2